MYVFPKNHSAMQNHALETVQFMGHGAWGITLKSCVNYKRKKTPKTLLLKLLGA